MLFLEVTHACYNASILRIVYFVKELLDIIFILIPIGLIVMLSIDLFKNTISSKEDEMRKNITVFIKRIFFCMAIFLIPTIVSFVVNMVYDSKVAEVWTKEEVNWITCYYDLTKEEVIDELKRIEESNSSKTKEEIEKLQEDYIKKYAKEH